MTDAPQSAGLVALGDRIELWPIDRLRPYDRNPRTHSEGQVDQIAASMVEFGWTNLVLVDEQGGILAGHGRLLATRKLGLADVPMIRFEHLFDGRGGYLQAGAAVALKAVGAPSAGLQERGGGQARTGPRAAERGTQRVRSALAQSTSGLPGEAPALCRLPGPRTCGAGDRGGPCRAPSRGPEAVLGSGELGAGLQALPRREGRTRGPLGLTFQPPGGGHLSTAKASGDRAGRRAFMPAKFGRGVSALS